MKSVDFHPVEPWVLCGLYSGHIFIWNYKTSQLVKSLEVSELPIRTARFIPSKHWIIVGADDTQIRIYNYNTLEKIKQLDAHSDYIRCIAIHPVLPLFLTASDDMTIKLWNYESIDNIRCIQTYEGHTHYVMTIEFNPKDGNTFASGSLDRTIKIWGLNSTTAHFTLEGHTRGVNCISYFRGGDKPYLISGADDQAAKIWDYQTKTCVSTLEGHTNNVSAALYHSTLPIILTASEDGTVRIWHANTYRLENTLNYGMERAWSLASLKGSNNVCIGFDDGTIMIKIGHEAPVFSMDNSGKVVYANNHDIVQVALRKEQIDTLSPADGERLSLSTKELGSCELYPQYIQHAPNGRLIVACGDGEYIIYMALSLKNKSFGSALDFVWGDADDKTTPYATRESNTKIVLYRNYKEYKLYKPSYAAELIFGGVLLGVRSNDFIDFIDWNELRTIRRIDVCPRQVYWSESGNLVVLACETQMYILRYNTQLVDRWLSQGLEVPEQGIEGSFELDGEIYEECKAGVFTGDCFIYVNTQNRLNYYIGGSTQTIAHLDKPMYLLGYLTQHNRIYLIDKQYNIYSYYLLIDILIYQTAIIRQEYDLAAQQLARIPSDQYNKLAHFLESHELYELAMDVSRDDEHRFELAMRTENYALAHSIAVCVESPHKWKILGDAALNKQFDIKLAIDCYIRAKDMGGLLLLYTTLGDASGIETLAELSKSEHKYNITFLCYFILNQPLNCVNLLLDNKRIPEAGYFARTYIPSQISRVVELWKNDLQSVSVTAADALANPGEHHELFDDYDLALQAEKVLLNQSMCNANEYINYVNNINRDIVAEIRDGTFQIDQSNHNHNSTKSISNESKYSTDEHKSLSAADDDLLQSDILQHAREEPIDPFASIITPVVSETIGNKPALSSPHNTNNTQSPLKSVTPPTVQSVNNQYNNIDSTQISTPSPQSSFYPPASHNNAQQHSSPQSAKPVTSTSPTLSQSSLTTPSNIPATSSLAPKQSNVTIPSPIKSYIPITSPAKSVTSSIVTSTNTNTIQPSTATSVKSTTSEIDDFDIDDFENSLTTTSNGNTRQNINKPTSDQLNQSLKDLEDELDDFE